MTPETDLRLFKERQGSLWVSDGSTVSAHATSVVDLIRSRRVRSVRFFGRMCQAESILAACSLGGRDPEVWIGSPMPIGRLRKPQEILQEMTSLSGLSPYFGGWHKADLIDSRTYGVLAAIDRDDLPQGTVLIDDHPANPALSFLAPWNDRLRKCYLVSAIGDPRWFHHDVNHPDRESKLRMFLGLTPRNVTMVMDGKEPSGYNAKRFTLLLHVLYSGPGRPVKFAEFASDSPNYFPQMLFHKLTKECGPYEAFMKAMEMAVSFIRQVWLHEIAPPGREVFVPEYFFEPLGKKLSEKVSEAYVRHRQNLPYLKPRLQST